MTVDLWVEASRDIDAEHYDLKFSRAKVAVASLWPFLSLAQSEGEFEQRLAIAASRIAEHSGEDLFEPVMASLRGDFRVATGIEPLTVESLVGKTATTDGAAAMRERYKGGDGTHGVDEDDEPYYEVGHPDGWKLRHYSDSTNAAIQHAATGDTYHDNLVLPGSGDKADPSLDHRQLTKILNNWADSPDAARTKRIDPRILRWRTASREAVIAPDAPLQIFHVASGKWISVEGALEGDMAAAAAQPTVGTPEAGPLTGETGGYPQHPTGADPFSPLSGEYPAQPQEWSGEGKPGWNENPMNFTPYRQANANPDYFAGGAEGAQGDQQTGFPDDASLDEDDYRVDEYGSVPPLDSSGTQGDGHPYSNAGSLGNRESVRGRRPFGEGQGFFDPGDASVRMVAAADSGTSSVGNVPEPPPTMMPDGPGAVAKEPMELTAANNVRQRPTDLNPGEVPDEYEANTWDGAAKQRPLQPAEHRNINTPQTPQDSIPQQSSSAEESEELRRESAWRMTEYLGLNLGWPQRTFIPPKPHLISVGAA